MAEKSPRLTVRAALSEFVYRGDIVAERRGTTRWFLVGGSFCLLAWSLVSRGSLVYNWPLLLGALGYAGLSVSLYMQPASTRGCAIAVWKFDADTGYTTDCICLVGIRDCAHILGTYVRSLSNRP